MKFTEILHIRNAALAREKAAKDAQKARDEAGAARDRAEKARQKQEAEAAREQHLRRMGTAERAYKQSGAEAMLKEAEKPFGAKIETVWDAEHEQYGQQFIWDKKQHGKSRRMNYMHPGGFFTPGWEWGPKIGEFRGKTIMVTVDAAHPERVEVRGRWRRWRVDVADKEKLDRVLGKAMRRPMKYRRVEEIKK